MDRRVPLAVASFALLAAVGLLGWGLYCGAKTVGEAGPGGQMGEPGCASYVSPGTWVALAGTVLGVASVVKGRWTWTVAVGAVLVLAGLPFVFSTGVFIAAVGLLIVLAGLLQRVAGGPWTVAG